MKKIPVLIFGVGGVGRALLRQIVASRAVVAGRANSHFLILGLVDSRGWRWQQQGMTDNELIEVLAAKERGEAVGPGPKTAAEALDYFNRRCGWPGLVVDVTAADGMEGVVDRALEVGHGVVLANKKPLAGPWEQAQRYYHQPYLRHESTVGGGQPVIATLRYLMDTNDPIERIEGQLSGTLGYICTRLDEGAPFSTTLAEARALGYTEPDPREDLGGRDVMRKIMILGRLAGWPLEEADIEVETLYSPSLAHLPVEEFMEAAVAMDAPMRERVEAAAANDSVLRYTAVVERGRGSVGLRPLGTSYPLANLKYISFQTRHYAHQPLMVGGKGAGVEMTAAGVLGDMIGLVREVLS